jgi:uncharacterized membrane protein
MNTSPRIDLEAVAKLIDALERDLAKVRADAGDVQALRDELEALRQALDVATPHDKGVRDRLHSLRERLEAESELTLGEGGYLTRIGRMLGM